LASAAERFLLLADGAVPTEGSLLLPSFFMAREGRDFSIEKGDFPPLEVPLRFSGCSLPPSPFFDAGREDLPKGNSFLVEDASIHFPFRKKCCPSPEVDVPFFPPPTMTFSIETGVPSSYGVS